MILTTQIVSYAFGKITEGFDLVGSQANEMEEELTKIEEKIIRYASMRNPFMDMTVCFDRKLALSVGGDPDIPFRKITVCGLNFCDNTPEWLT